jgi:hypothetical protein
MRYLIIGMKEGNRNNFVTGSLPVALIWFPSNRGMVRQVHQDNYFIAQVMSPGGMSF